MSMKLDTSMLINVVSTAGVRLPASMTETHVTSDYTRCWTPLASGWSDFIPGVELVLTGATRIKDGQSSTNVDAYSAT